MCWCTIQVTAFVALAIEEQQLVDILPCPVVEILKGFDDLIIGSESILHFLEHTKNMHSMHCLGPNLGFAPWNDNNSVGNVALRKNLCLLRGDCGHMPLKNGVIWSRIMASCCKMATMFGELLFSTVKWQCCRGDYCIMPYNGNAAGENVASHC